MPLHGKIVVIKRGGSDGTEFPLTATCLFGRKPDCDIRIQLPQVSKEHCRIDLNENKEVVLTNLSSVNPTQVNGEVLQQSERLKHGDIITIIDRSFRFEYPPAPTPKKRSSVGGKNETLKALQDQHVTEKGATETGEKRISVVSTEPPLKDGTNHDNIQRSMDRTMELESSETSSPFSDLYQMIKKSLDVKTPRKSSASLLQTPASRFCSPKPVSVKKNDENPITSTGDKCTPKRVESEVLSGAAAAKINGTTPKSVKKQRESLQVSSDVMAGPEAQNVVQSGAASPLRRHSATNQRPAVSEGTEKDNAQMPKSPMRRRSREATPAKPAVTSPKTDLKRASPRNSGKVQTVNETSKKRKSGELAADLPEPQMKKKRVSFGGHLTPELFDKRLPPDSPLRKGATPRRSLCLFKPKQSLLRRASVIGLLQEFEHENPDTGAAQSPAKTKSPSSAKKASPKARSSSPKTDTPAKQSPKSKSSSTKAASPGTTSPKARSPSSKAVTEGKQSPKSRSPSPKAVTPAKKSPKSRSSSPTAAASTKQSPKTRSPSAKAVTPAKKSPKSESLSPAKGRSPSTSKVGIPACQTPTVQGRFSVSRISTPSPLEETASTNEGPLDTETPKLDPRRKSTARKSQGVGKSAVKAKCRRSSISRASMKVMMSWADRVKFGRAKSQVAVPAKMKVTKGIVKKSVPKPKTPARKLESYASTGHANSPATIVVGRAHRQKIVHPTGAAPRLVTNIAVLKKDMKMNEDLTGIAEMYKTPVTKKRRSAINENSTVKTPAGDLGTSVVEPSVLNTPEELGEMMVSPLSVSSRVEDSGYNSEAVLRLFNEAHESSCVGDVLPVVTADEDQQHTDTEISAATPKQKPKLPDCLTGVKRIMKTPKQKAEPIEDLRGKILKTPKQKPVQQECLTGVKRIMKTPKQKAEPIEDLRGKILKTPKQKQPVQQECLTGVKRIMKTPKQKSEPVEDLRGKILKTPKQKLEPQECLSGVKRIFNTPQAEAEPLEEPQDELEVCSAEEAGEASSDGVEENLEMPAEKQVSEDLAEMTNTETPRVRTPREKNAPVEDFVAMRKLMKTPRQKCQAVKEKFGIKRLVKTPRQKVDAPVEDFEGLKELMEEPQPEPTGQLETNEVEDQTSDCQEEIAKELNIAHEEPQNEVQSNVPDVPDVEMEAGAENKEAVTDDHLEQLPHDDKSSDTKETISEVAVDDKLPVEEPKVNTSDDKLSEENPEMETAPGQEIESATDPAPEVKSVRGRRGKNVGTKSVEEKRKAPEPSEDAVIPASVRGRRGKKAEATAPPTVRQTTRGRNAKATESTDTEMETDQDAPLPSKVAPKPKRGRGAKQASADQAEIVQEVEAAKVPELEAEPSDVNQESNEGPVEKVVVKPRRGRRAKQPVHTEQEEVPATLDDLPPTDKSEETDSKEVVPSETDQNKSSDVTDDSPQTPEEEAAPCKVTEIDAPVVEKKSVRGRRAKVVESKSPEDKDEVTEHSENPVVPTPVRGRRGKKTEAAAPPAVRQTKRGRNAKSEDSPSDQPDANTEAVSDQNSAVEAIQEEKEPEPEPKKAVVKPTRGRKAKTAIEPPQPESEKTSDASEELPKEDAQPQQPIPSLGKSGRGKRTAVEQPEVAEDTAATVEAKQSSKPPARARRGRNAKQEEEKPEGNDKTVLLETTEPVKKSRRTRKAEEDHVEQREEQSGEIAVPDQAETPEPMKMTEQANTATKPRRGGRKAKQTPIECTDVQEIPAVSTTEKPKRGRRGKKVTEEADATTVLPEETPDCEPEPEAEEKKTTEPEAPASKPGRGRAAKKEVSQVPAKRARRGAAPPDSESNTKSTDQVSESAVTSVEPPKRGRRAAAKPVVDETIVTSDQTNPSEGSQSAVVEDDKKTKRSVKWKTDLEVFEIQKVTPVKAVRGRKSKFEDRVGSDLPEKACITEEKDLSDNAVEAQPAKRARRGAKVVPTDNDQSTSKGKDVEAETQPKTRRGRSAKK